MNGEHQRCGEWSQPCRGGVSGFTDQFRGHEMNALVRGHFIDNDPRWRQFWWVKPASCTWLEDLAWADLCWKLYVATSKYTGIFRCLIISTMSPFKIELIDTMECDSHAYIDLPRNSITYQRLSFFSLKAKCPKQQAYCVNFYRFNISV